ncbi:MAG: 5'/3'-nucleotidase SurE [Acidimicrobiales bacterium]
MRILVTNDDGVRAPGIAALAAVAAATDHEVVVVAPMIDYSGAGAAVGPVHSRDGVDYETYEMDGVVGVPTYAVDGPPALAVILACVGGFGPRPDVVLCGINQGANVGRSVMHSGTVGAALTAAHFGLRCLAVSVRWGPDPVPWSTPAALAGSLIPVLAGAPAGATLNLNVPDVDLVAVRGVRRGRLSRGGTIRSAVHTAGDGFDHPHVALPPGPSGTLRLDLTAPGQTAPAAPDTDTGLVSRDYASLTPLVGVGEPGAGAGGDGGSGSLMDTALAALHRVCPAGAGSPPENVAEVIRAPVVN